MGTHAGVVAAEYLGQPTVLFAVIPPHAFVRACQSRGEFTPELGRRPAAMHSLHHQVVVPGPACKHHQGLRVIAGAVEPAPLYGIEPEPPGCGEQFGVILQRRRMIARALVKIGDLLALWGFNNA